MDWHNKIGHDSVQVCVLISVGTKAVGIVSWFGNLRFHCVSTEIGSGEFSEADPVQRLELSSCFEATVYTV